MIHKRRQANGANQDDAHHHLHGDSPPPRKFPAFGYEWIVPRASRPCLSENPPATKSYSTSDLPCPRSRPLRNRAALLILRQNLTSHRGMRVLKQLHQPGVPGGLRLVFYPL